jgi:hypothetical protein
MAHQFDATLVREPLMCGLEHWLGDIETNADAVGSGQPQQGEQASVPRAEVQDSPRVARHVIEQDALTLAAVRQPVGRSRASDPLIGRRGASAGRTTRGRASEGGRTAPAPGGRSHGIDPQVVVTVDRLFFGGG